MSWSEVRIGDACELINGRAFKPSEWTSHGLPIVRIQNLTDETAPFNRFNGQIRDRFLIDNGALLFSWSGTPGTSFGAFFWNRGPAVLNQHIFNVVVREYVDPNYFRYALNSRLKRIIAQAHGGVGLQHITKEKLEATTVPLPPLSEQRRIAGILDKADAIRRKRKEAIAVTEELLRSAFLDMFGDPVTNPKGWDVKPFGRYLEFVTSGSRGWAEHYSDKGARFIRSLDVQMDRIADDDPAYVVAPPGAEAERTRTRQDDVLLTITGSKIGRAARVTAAHATAYVSQHVAILRFLPGLDPDVVTAFMVNDRGGQALIARTQYGQTKPGLNLAQIREFPIPVPPVAVQARIRTAREQVRALQKQLAQALNSADGLFRSLIHQTFS